MPSPNAPGERGAGSVELAVTAPLLLLVILISVQAALWAHAAQVTRAVADTAAETTRLSGATPAAGRTRARQLLQRLGHRLLLDPQITVTRTATTARVTIAAGTQRLIPGLTMRTRATASAPVERLTSGGAP